MNNDFDFEPKREEITMTDAERKSHKKIFSRLCLAFSAYILTADVLSTVLVAVLEKLAPELLKSGNFSIIASSVLQYLIAFPVLYFIMKGIPAKAPAPSKLTVKQFLKFSVVGMFVMYVGNYISSMIMIYMEMLLGFTPENTVETVLSETSPILSVLIIGIIGPIVEELMCRKLFIDRLTPYGEAIAVFVPSLVFGLLHGNLYQFFYAFLLGVAFSYIYVKTGKLIYSTLLHIFINLFCGVFPSYILTLFDYEEFLELSLAGTVTEEYIMANLLPLILLTVYEFVMLAMVGAGVYNFTKNLRNIRFEKGKVRFPKGAGADIMFFNAGAILLVTLCALMMAINTFAV